ncbi:MAG TPA: translation initiation factor IF-3, partial [Desulfobacteraceae bacterium]
MSKKPAVRVNEQIKAKTVRLISVDGKQIGIVP